MKPRPAPGPFAGADAAPPTAREKSKSHQNRGKAWEQRIDAQHALYTLRGVSCVRNPAPMKILRPAGRPGMFLACFASEGPPDYHVQVNGRSVLLEAKSMAGDRFELSAVEPHQADRMTLHEANGGRALVFALVGDAIWFLPWRTLEPLYREHAGRTGRAAPGTASLDADTLSVIGFDLADPDWLPTAIRLWRT